MTRLANAHGAINLAQGFPDFDGPAFAKDAAIAAIREGHGQYARMSGIPELHAALSAKYRRDWALDYAADAEITVTSGATEAIFAAIQGICDAGDEVVLFEPYYDSYKASVRMAGAVPRVVTLPSPSGPSTAARSGRPSAIARARSCSTPRTIPPARCSLPRSWSFSRASAASATSCASPTRCTSTSSTTASTFPWRPLPGMRERTITISSFGKTFSLTGWKIGWAAAPAALTAAVRAAHQFITFATATPLQHGAAVALAQAGEDYYATLLGEYREKRDFLVRELSRLGFEVRPPAGAYFVCADFRPFGFDDDRKFVRHLIENVGVAAIPPSVFYDRAEPGRGYVRFAFCKKRETLEAAVSRLEKLCR